MKVTYVYHSCFIVETKKQVMIFDYYKGEIPKFSSDKSIYVFASHKHADHFNKVILEWADEYQDITYILSKDIKMNENYMNRLKVPDTARNRIQYMGADTSLKLDELMIETIDSTDAGVAFIITCEEGCIYHAGDLNWWVWEDDTEQEYKTMTNAFMKEMDKIKDRTFDIAFLPLDPRQNDLFYLGFDKLMRTAKVKQAYPMHFGDDSSVIGRLILHECSKDYKDRIVTEY